MTKKELITALAFVKDDATIMVYDDNKKEYYEVNTDDEIDVVDETVFINIGSKRPLSSEEILKSLKCGLSTEE